MKNRVITISREFGSGGLCSGFCFFIARQSDDFSKKACHVTQTVEKFEILCYTFLVQTIINPVFDEVRLSDEMYCVL